MQEHKNHSKKKDQDESPPAESTADQDKKDKLDYDVDAFLDEIDDVLEENAEDFVKAYVQKGGE